MHYLFSVLQLYLKLSARSPFVIIQYGVTEINTQKNQQTSRNISPVTFSLNRCHTAVTAA